MGKVMKVFKVPSFFTVTGFGYGEETGWMLEFETLEGGKGYMTIEEFYEMCSDCRSIPYNPSLDDCHFYIGGTE